MLSRIEMADEALKAVPPPTFIALSAGSLVSLSCVNKWHIEQCGTLVLLLKGTIYLETPKHYCVVSVLKNICMLASRYHAVKMLVDEYFSFLRTLDACFAFYDEDDAFTDVSAVIGNAL